MRELADVWVGCGCLFAFAIIGGGLVLVAASGGAGAGVAVLALVGVGAYFAWTYRTNHYDEHGCRVEYLYTENGWPKRYTRDQVGRDIPADVARRHPDHFIGE